MPRYARLLLVALLGGLLTTSVVQAPTQAVNSNDGDVTIEQLTMPDVVLDLAHCYSGTCYAFIGGTLLDTAHNGWSFRTDQFPAAAIQVNGVQVQTDDGFKGFLYGGGGDPTSSQFGFDLPNTLGPGRYTLDPIVYYLKKGTGGSTTYESVDKSDARATFQVRSQTGLSMTARRVKHKKKIQVDVTGTQVSGNGLVSAGAAVLQVRKPHSKKWTTKQVVPLDGAGHGSVVFKAKRGAKKFYRVVIDRTATVTGAVAERPKKL